MTENMAITKDVADAARAQIKAYRQALRARAEGMMARRNERNAEMESHDAESIRATMYINRLKNEITQHLDALAEIKGEIDARRESAAVLQALIDENRQAAAIAVANRNAARAALKKLRDEIRGEGMVS